MSMTAWYYTMNQRVLYCVERKAHSLPIRNRSDSASQSLRSVNGFAYQ